MQHSNTYKENDVAMLRPGVYGTSSLLSSFVFWEGGAGGNYVDALRNTQLSKVYPFFGKSKRAPISV